MDGVVVMVAAQLMTQLVAEHLGALHPFEKVLTLVLAFGPFVLLAVVVLIRRRQDAAAEVSAEVSEERQDPAAQDSER